MTTSAVIDSSQCEKDHKLWIEETARWQEEHKRALKTLEDTAAFIRQHDAELEDHLVAVRKHESVMNERGEPDEKIREAHLEVKERHNRFRGRHTGLIKEVLQLQVALHKAGMGHIF